MTTNNQNSELTCQLCKTSHTSEWELKEHMWSLMHHVKLEQKEKNTSHQCVLCHVSTENLVDYGRHLNEQTHKQALEKAKEKKKVKARASSSRHALQKAGKQKQKKALMPNPHWHLNSSYNPVFQFVNWKPRDDFHWKKHSNHPELQGSNPQHFNNNNNPYWNNDGNFHRFNANNKNPYERWNDPNHMINGSRMKVNQPNPNSICQNPAGKKFIVTPNNQKPKKGPLQNKAPPLGTKNSKSTTDSEGQQKPLETSSKTADKPKVNTSPVSKLKTNISKLKTKAASAVKPPVNKKKEKQSQGQLFFIDKDGEGNAIDKGGGETLEDNPSRKKFIVETAAKKSVNIHAAPFNKKPPPPPKKGPQVMLRNSRATEKRRVSAENKTESCRSPTKKNSPANTNNSTVKPSGNVSSKEGASGSSKRSLSSDNSPNSSSGSSPNKKRKSEPSEPRKTMPETDSSNLSAVTSPGSNSKPKTLVKNNSPKPNDSSEKDNPLVVSLDSNPTEEPTASPKILPSTQNENGFKVNSELVTKLHKKLVGQSPMKLPNSKVRSRSGNQDNQTHSNDEVSPSPAGCKQSPVKVRREELVKMMKLPRLSRKEKMHLSSLLQSYTKSQNKKLAVPRLTMQLSGLYDGANQEAADVVGEMSELELPAGMEEEIAHLIKREKLDELPVDGIIDNQNLGLATSLSIAALQRAKKKNVPDSVNKQKPVRNQNILENRPANQSPDSVSKRKPIRNQTLMENPPQANLSSLQGSSNIKMEISDNQRLSDAVSSPAVRREPTNNSRRESNMQLDNNSSFSSTLPDPPITSLQINSSAPMTTGTLSDPLENIIASSHNNRSDTMTTGTSFSENVHASSYHNPSAPVTTGTLFSESVPVSSHNNRRDPVTIQFSENIHSSSYNSSSAPVTTGTLFSESVPVSSHNNRSDPVTTQFSENIHSSSYNSSSAPVTTGTLFSESVPVSSHNNRSDPVTTQFSENVHASSYNNSSAPVTTGTATRTNMSNNSNTENVFNKVYLLTLREEQIRSSIVDMNEKMNYLRKLIEDSQMALQGCCTEHTRLLEEENRIRDQRLKILQDAMNNAEPMNPSLLQQNSPTPPSQLSPAPQTQQTPAPQSLQLPVSNPQPEQTFSQTDLGLHRSSTGHVMQSQPSRTVTHNQFNNNLPVQTNFPAGSEVIPPSNGRSNQTEEPPPVSRSSDPSPNLLKSEPLIQSSVLPDPLPSVRHSPILSVSRNNTSRQNQNKQSSPVNTVDTISLGSKATSTNNNGFSGNRNPATNISANVAPSQAPSLAFANITIKQEPPSPPPSQVNIETVLSNPLGIVNNNNNTCNSSAPSSTTFPEAGRHPEGAQTESVPLNNATDKTSGDASKPGLAAAADRENETVTLETAEIKKEPLTPAPQPQPQPQNETEKQSKGRSEQQVESRLKRNESSCEDRQDSPDRRAADVTPDETPEQSRHNELHNTTAEQSSLSTLSKTPTVDPVINFESIKREPLTPPPPNLQVEVEETFFVPRLPAADTTTTNNNNNNENPAPSVQNETESDMEIDKTAENICSPPSSRNLSGSGGQTETPGKSSGMSMTYLGKMPNNFLEQLALSWRKQNMSDTADEGTGLINEYSFSDSESTSSRTVCNFISKTGPQFSVPARLNPRVCLEPLNMKYHRKRTLSEPVSSCDSGSLTTVDVQQHKGSRRRKDDPGNSSAAKKSSSEKGGSNCDDKTDSAVFEKGPRVKRKSLRRRSCSHERRSNSKGNRSENPADPSTEKDKDSSESNVTNSIANNEEDELLLDLSGVDNLKESKLCNRPTEGSESDLRQNNPAGYFNESSDVPPIDAQTEINFDPKSPTNPLNIWNNLSSLHVVRTKKFPRSHINGNQLPTFRGAKNPVNGLYVFESHLYASYQGNSPCKFSLSNGECVQIYDCQPYNVQCMLVCRIGINKTRLFSGGASEVLLVFDEVTGSICSQIDTNQKIYSFHENWGSLFVGLANGGVTKINMRTLKKTSELSYGSKPINCLATCTEGAQKLLCVGAYDASILIVDAMTGLLLKTLNCYHRLLYSIKVLNNFIFSCSSDKTLQVHDVTSGKLLRCLQDHTSTISCLHVEDKLLVTGSHDKRLNIYNSSRPREAPVIFYTTSKESISCLAVHNKVIYCGNFFGNIETVQFDTGQKWVCKYDSCELVFGQRQGLFYHLVNQHLQMTGMDKKKCLWENCGEYIYSVLDITEHYEDHLNQIAQSE